jgi:ferric iron reductase protein FhuF
MLKAQADFAQDNLARELRAAVLGSDHAKAARLAEQYTAALSRQWASMSEPERASSGIPKQAAELLTWAREVTIMHHAMAAQHLSAVQKANRYLTARANYLRTAAIE